MDRKDSYQEPCLEQRHSTRKVSKWLSTLTLVVVSFVFGFQFLSLSFSAVKSRLDGLSKASFENVCAQPEPAAQTSNFSAFYSSLDFRMESAKRLSGAIQIPTMSYDDMGPTNEDERWKPFKEFHSYLRTTFPVVHDTAKLAIVGGYSPIYTFTGLNSSLKPLLLAAHQDVVPAVSSLERWTYPPFSGKIDGEWIYGRGSSDCKNNLIGILTSVEHLIKSGWKPRRTLVLAFGQDEEISGPRGAVNIAKYLESEYGENGIAMIVDEGGMGIDEVYGADFAMPGIAEKGYTNMHIEVDMLGGHSSVPSQHTTIGILSKIVSAVEDSQVFKPHLETTSPIWGYLSCVAQHGSDKDVPSWIKKSIFSKKPNLDLVAKKFAQISLPNRYLVQTSKVPTIFHAGVKVNAMAESATVTFNSRVDIHSTPKDVQTTYLALIKPIAEKYSLLFNGRSVSSEPSIGNISAIPSDGSLPSPISPFTLDSTAWKVFARAVQASFGKDVISAPSAMTGNTDTRHYWNLSKNIYRWSPARIGTRLNAHTVDEKIMIDSHIDGIKFYTELIIQSDIEESNAF
ncbi:hypothetical protein BDQ12DRAFT_738741 [Crucibulum laeve]|uniref:Peptidase M20 dimerisation domain-containing protein n=1 Tax=Crucibulum laeve TaxID=68775 RepID=A0A5C3LLF5_9AGAR|nr:hypothetical protein BDQ12DRAFT_738741 [Crucibulum laeve]